MNNMTLRIINIKISDEEHRLLRILAAEQGKTLRQVVRELIQTLTIPAQG